METALPPALAVPWNMAKRSAVMLPHSLLLAPRSLPFHRWGLACFRDKRLPIKGFGEKMQDRSNHHQSSLMVAVILIGSTIT